MLKITNLNKSFGSKNVLKNISFSAPAGKITGFIGKNGSGKTTTFHSILNFIDYSGNITFNDKRIDENSYANIGYLPEERSLMPKLTVYSQVKYLANLKGMSTAKVKSELPKWLDRLQVVGKMNDKIKSLSKGNQQKIQLIATLIHKPDLIILDEPFSGLDPVNTDLLKQVIFAEQARGATIIFSDHSMNNVEELCDNVIMINNGLKVLDGSIQDVRESFGLTRIFVRTPMTETELASLPHVISVNLTKNGSYRLVIDDEQAGKELYSLLTKGEYIRTFNQEAPTLDEIFKMKAGETIA
ncbi:ABC transporter ATP-binding protein [Ligilactobacillus salivarius]|uniref:ABC transporter ATP-binding protein n=1 Tax=Ligilactobacillus salivarius TaxID=1624 RepID=UPI000B97A909|nr:ABC transporter ATP-binding protein [Ligilactobacillus salivarius]MCR4913668.1 ABC transporter ATP-binding protein [Lactobacillus sp.]OYP91823.1 sodium ABC transporter ATP-binding protein [Ligilactobacillus salivarius]